MKKLTTFLFFTVLCSSLVLGAITCGESMDRSGPSTVTPGQTFQVTYTAQDTSGDFAASIIDTVSGGCQFPAGDELRTVMISDEGTIKTVSVTAPSSGSCTFIGDYKFGTCNIGLFS